MTQITTEHEGSHSVSNEAGIEIIPACTCPQTKDELAATAAQIHTYAAWMHLDICDGTFAGEGPSWPCASGQQAELLEMTTKPHTLPEAQTLAYEVHLMVSRPRELALLFSRAGADRVAIHLESFSSLDDARDTLHLLRGSGVHVGLALKHQTPAAAVEPLLPKCDFVQLMSIGAIGAQGAVFEESSLERITQIRERNPELPITVDGGVSKENIERLVKAGATRLVVGSALSLAQDSASTYAGLLASANAVS